MSEKRDEPSASDFRVVVYQQNGPKRPVLFGRAWWSLRPGGILPYLKFKVMIAGKNYIFALMPNRSDSYPTPKIINRELLRQSAQRAHDEGFIEFGPESEEDDKESDT